jgi:hypothetical protein
MRKASQIRYKIKPHFKGQSKEKRNGEVYGEFLSSRFSKAPGFFADLTASLQTRPKINLIPTRRF